MTYYANAIFQEVENGRKTPAQGLQALKEEDNSLLSQAWEVGQKGVGVIAGAMQVAAGAGVCYGSVGTLCAVFGVPLMAHGANNVYENSRDLFEGRNDTEGIIRKGYHELARMMGAGSREGDIAYGVADLGMSAFGLGRQILKKDSWRLFRYIHHDYVRAYKTMSWKAMTLEAATDAITLDGVSNKFAEDK